MMCMEDVKIGREAPAGQTNIAPTSANSIPALPGADNRYAVVFCAPVIGHVTYSITSPVVLGQGLNLGAGDGAVWLNIKDHGELVTMPWFAISDQAGGAPVGIMWSLLPRRN